ncbi:hypothetical protein [Candidatus Pelagibacter bacterium nBUS_32]|uniref:hypothetical protein n=1 Tax=Candidatus Pelagibacter bacterium nBUS_32 TaxID=3374192 RepID=UPI003EC05BAF
MKKDDQEITLLNSDIVSNNDLKRNNFKTTNVNILLNRVKVDKKNDLKKKIIFLSILIFVISIVTGFALF